MPKFAARDIIAILALVVCTILLCRGIDTTVGWSLLGTVAGYFGIEVAPGVITRIRGKGE